ncbi:ATP-binding SpoIIE family protein phosphatase [Streptomyces sp. NRRL F-5630]|uniref:ATP-binding SpoIIE family protein phosphatase n=1 Tax=Streptomyces sp. NRRL F-5630 TaxID=1463864 RepID=UPI003D721CE0
MGTLEEPDGRGRNGWQVGAYDMPRAEDVAWLRVDVALPAAARSAAAQLCHRLGFGARRTSEVALAVTEAATNLQRHAGDGSLLLRLVRTPDEAALEFLALDSGPGMSDVAYSLRDGASSAGTLGVGLGTIGRLADGFGIHSLPERGTVVTARFWPDREGGPHRPEPLVAGLTRPISGEIVCGDAWAARPVAATGDGPGAVLVMMCDGLGHGPLAARAGELAVEAFLSSTAREPDEVLRVLHGALRGGRGAAVGVAKLDLATRRVRFCGAGNISAYVIGEGRRRSLGSAPGIVGHQLPRLRVFDDVMAGVDGTLLLHSDGLTSRWEPGEFPGLFTMAPLTVAGQIFNQAAVRRDDAGLVVARLP